ncbi:MAG TPA: hypothetical protein VLG25_03220 [Patescibacteria group bacterium]|nr:hypothetical protein [Patescibacteria group bacterium]
MSPEMKSGEARRIYWSILGGRFNPEEVTLDAERLNAIAVHIRNSGNTLRIYFPVIYAIEISNPELFSDEFSKVTVEKDLSDVIHILNPEEYDDEKLGELRRRVPELDSSPPPVMMALGIIFEGLEKVESELVEKEVVVKEKASGVKARAYGTIRGIYLVQNGMEDKFPIPIKDSVK